MSLIIPSRKDVVSALQAYVRAYLPELDPTTTRRSYIGGKVKSLGSALHDWYVALKRYADNEPFPQTASRDFLLYGWWRDVTRLSPNPAAPATGRVVLLGTAGSTVDAGTALSSGNQSYTVDVSASIVTQEIAATSLTRTQSTAIFETAAAHHLATGMTLTISGAEEGAYNGTFPIVVTAENEFTYDLGDAAPTTPATGSVIVSGTWGNALVTADTNGPDGNLDAGSSMTIDGVAGVDSRALVTFGEIAGGTDVETTESYRSRILEALGTDYGMFSAAEIKIVAKTVPGVTRVWVREASLFGTNGVNEGQVHIAFMRDADANPFPSASEVETVKTTIVTAIMPAHTAIEDVVVMAPTPLIVDINLSTIVPNTASMRRAIEARLTQFFLEEVTFGETITSDALRCAIYSTYDREGRSALRSFVLATPEGDVPVDVDELPRLGRVTFG